MTAVLASPGDAEYARALTDRIKAAVEGTWHLITEAYQSRAWSVLGYSSWDDYCTREFGQSRLRLPREDRTETVQSLRSAGLSLRAIAAATGESKDTVARVLAPVSFETPAEPAPVIVDRETGEVLDDWDEVVDEPPGFAEKIAAELAAADSGYAERAAETVAPKVTGTDGKSYPKATDRKPPRKPLAEVAKGRGFTLRQAMESVERIFSDDRYRTNEKQVADALRGHLLYVAETVAAVLDQLP